MSYTIVEVKNWILFWSVKVGFADGRTRKIRISLNKQMWLFNALYFINSKLSTGDQLGPYGRYKQKREDKLNKWWRWADPRELIGETDFLEETSK